MNLFQKFFGKKEGQLKSNEINEDLNPSFEEKSENPTQITMDRSYNNSYSFVSRIKGLDNDFIDLIYFSNDETKISYREKIIKTLSDLGINFGDDFHKVKSKIIEFNNTLKDYQIPFLLNSLMVEDFNVENNNGIITETKSEQQTKGIEKLNGYYKAASFIIENIELKLKYQYFDVLFEEKLYNEFITVSDLNNYAKLNSIFSLGIAFAKGSELKKAENYFNLIEKTNFDLQPATVSEFYRNVGEYYIEINENEKALKWLKSGLEINPKLGVKKTITKLEV